MGETKEKVSLLMVAWMTMTVLCLYLLFANDKIGKERETLKSRLEAHQSGLKSCHERLLVLQETNEELYRELSVH